VTQALAPPATPHQAEVLLGAGSHRTLPGKGCASWWATARSPAPLPRARRAAGAVRVCVCVSRHLPDEEDEEPLQGGGEGVLAGAKDVGDGGGHVLELQARLLPLQADEGVHHVAGGGPRAQAALVLQELAADEAVEVAVEVAEGAVGGADGAGEAAQPGQRVHQAAGAHRPPELLVAAHQAQELAVAVAVAAPEAEGAHHVGHGHQQRPRRVEEGAARAAAHQQRHQRPRLAHQVPLQQAAGGGAAGGEGAHRGVGRPAAQLPQLRVAAEGQAAPARHQPEGGEGRAAGEGGALADQGLADGALAVQHHHGPAAQAQLEDGAVGAGQAGEGEVRGAAQLRRVADHGPGEGARRRPALALPAAPAPLQEELAQVDGGEQAEQEQQRTLRGGAAAQGVPEPLQGHAARQRDGSAGGGPAGGPGGAAGTREGEGTVAGGRAASLLRAPRVPGARPHPARRAGGHRQRSGRRLVRGPGRGRCGLREAAGAAGGCSRPDEPPQMQAAAGDRFIPALPSLLPAGGTGFPLLRRGNPGTRARSPVPSRTLPSAPRLRARWPRGWAAEDARGPGAAELTGPASHPRGPPAPAVGSGLSAAARGGRGENSSVACSRTDLLHAASMRDLGEEGAEPGSRRRI